MGTNPLSLSALNSAESEATASIVIRHVPSARWAPMCSPRFSMPAFGFVGSTCLRFSRSTQRRTVARRSFTVRLGASASASACRRARAPFAAETSLSSSWRITRCFSAFTRSAARRASSCLRRASSRAAARAASRAASSRSASAAGSAGVSSQSVSNRSVTCSSSTSGSP